MKPLYHFLLEPKDGEIYNSSSGGMLLTASYENYKTTQRIARVLETPAKYEGPINPGDYVITHHNVFRKSFDMKGRLSNSSDFLEEGKYLVDPERLYMTSKDGVAWSALYPYVFVSPVKNDSKFSDSVFKKEHGIIEYSSDSNVHSGDLVRFSPDSECEFLINDTLLYRMKNTDLIWKIL